MTVQEAEEYYEPLSAAEAQRFNLLVTVGMKLGKPIEGAYDYAKVIMEKAKEDERK